MHSIVRSSSCSASFTKPSTAALFPCYNLFVGRCHFSTTVISSAAGAAAARGLPLYLSKKDHYLSSALFKAAFVHLVVLSARGLIRLIIRGNHTITPDMADNVMWNSQLVLSVVRLAAIAFIFYKQYKHLSRKLSVIDKDDQLHMAILQREVFGDDLAVLSGDIISALVRLWAFILVGVQLIYDISSWMYRAFINQLLVYALQSGEYLSFVTVYNYTHTFKYAGMLVAILLGIMATGIFLNDRKLMIFACVIAVLYLISFSLIRMQDITVLGKSVGLVWSSVIYYALETAGILGVSFYLRRKYLGL